MTDRPDEARSMAELFGFRYIHRPDWPAGKKAGNLRYAFSQTSAEYLVILDADFAVRRDFLAETLPYMDDPKIGIVQTPQYFRSSPAQTWIERSAGPIQEVFYRTVQVARNRLDAAVCCGTSALYRRTALEPCGGATLIPYAEDVHTGLDVRRAAIPSSISRSCSRPGSAPTISTPSCGSSTAGAQGTSASCSPGGCGRYP